MKRTVLLLASLTAGLALAGVLALGVPHERAQAAFPGINGKIAFVSNRSGNNEIYTIWFTGDNLTRLTHNSKPDNAPSWSPDGKKLVFERGSHLYTMYANGNKQKEVPNATFYNYDFGGRIISYGGNPAFSPSGRKLIYDAGDIYTINVDGTNRTRITNYKPTDPYEDNPNFANPVWSPVSNKIAFTWSTQIHVMPLSDLMGEKYLGDGPVDSKVTPWWTYRPDWSPDGAQITYECYYDPCSDSAVSHAHNSEIYRINADGSFNTRLTTDPATDTYPAFSPGGSKIVFSSNRGGDYDIYIMDADGTDVQQLTNNPAKDILPDWQPVQ